MASRLLFRVLISILISELTPFADQSVICFVLSASACSRADIYRAQDENLCPSAASLRGHIYYFTLGFLSNNSKQQ